MKTYFYIVDTTVTVIIIITSMYEVTFRESVFVGQGRLKKKLHEGKKEVGRDGKNDQCNDREKPPSSTPSVPE